MDGGLVETTNVTLLTSELICGKLVALFETEETEFNKLAVLKYLLEQYVHIRGCWFVKFMKGSRSESAGVTKAHAAPVRTQVAFTHMQSKDVNKAKVETKLKEEAAWDAALRIGQKLVVMNNI